MAYWWVNQGKTFESASRDGFLWAPNPTKGNKPDWKNMLRLQIGDTVFCYSKKLLRAVCTITAQPVPMQSPYPEDWDMTEPGTVVLANYVLLPNPLSYNTIVYGSSPISLIGASPVLQLADRPALGYLFSLPDSAGSQLLNLCNVPLPASNVPALPPSTKTGTTKLYLALARDGQGIFGKKVREACGSRCAITGIMGKGLMLQAAHIKPWAKSNDKERLDPENGILLHATVHHAFDQGLLSFADDGSLLLDPAFIPTAAQLGLTRAMSLPDSILSPERRDYFAQHRSTHGFA